MHDIAACSVRAAWMLVQEWQENSGIAERRHKRGKRDAFESDTDLIVLWLLAVQVP